MEKGTYGYIDYYKKRKLKIAAVFIALIAISVIAVLCVFETKNTYWIAIPILLVLPFAKYFVAYIVVKAYATMPEQDYEKVRKLAERWEHIFPVYDVTLASEAGISYLEVLIIIDGVVYGCASSLNKKFHSKDIQAYLQKLVKTAGYESKVFIYDSLEDTLDAAAKRIESFSEEHSFQDKRSRSIKKAILVVGV